MTSLAQLQSLIKKNKDAYRDEFLSQYQHFMCYVDIFKCSPKEYNQGMVDVLMFLIQVANLYNKLNEIIDIIVDLFKTFSVEMNPELRIIFCRSLFISTRFGQDNILKIMPHIINLLQSDSKINTGLISSNIVTTVKNLSRKSKSNLILKSMKKQIITGLESSSVYISYGCLKIVVKLIYSNIWRDEETVNVIATLVFNKHNKVNRKALSVMSNEHIDDDSSDEDEATVAREKYKQISMANKISKTTNKRKRKLQTAVKHMKNAKKPKNVQPNDKTLVRLIYDTDKYSSRLFKKLEFGKEHFPVKMVIMKLISRMIDEFKIIMPNFITFLYRYIHPRQKDVTKILLYLALSMHTNVPNETVLASMRVVSNAFINDRNSDDAVTVGINTIREISIRCINAIDKELLMDLIEYRKMKNRNIKSAARSLLNLYRDKKPELLTKKYQKHIPSQETSDDDSQSDSENESNVNSNIESASETTESENELDLNKIEKMIKRKKQTKIEKLNTVNEGRADREKFGKKKTKFKVATSNKEKRKTKNFMMLRQKFIKNSRKKTYVQRLKNLKKQK